MFRLFPKIQNTIHSPLSVEEIHRRLKQHCICSHSIFSIANQDHIFYGKIDSNHFTVSYYEGFRNSFRAEMAGTVTPLPTGSTIELILQHSAATKVITIFYNLFALQFWFVALFLPTQGDAQMLLWLLPLMLLAIDAVFYLAFFRSARETLSYLNQILDEKNRM